MNTRQFITAGLIASVMTFVGSAAAQEPEAAAKTPVEKKAKEPSPLLAPGLQAADANYTDAEKAELDALEALVRRFTDSAESYRKSARELIEHKFNKKRNLLVNYYEDAVQQLEEEQRVNRLQAIEQFENFVRSHPDGDDYTADAMFRLSELYYERSYDEYLQANDDFELALESWILILENLSLSYRVTNSSRPSR